MAAPATDPVQQNADAYNKLRTQATQNAGNNAAQGTDAIQRRFAAMGGQNSGANIQAIGDLNRGTSQGLNDTLANIGVQEQGANLQAGQLGVAQKAQAAQESQFRDTLPLQQQQMTLQQQELASSQHANDVNEALGRQQLRQSGGLFGGGGFAGLGF